MDRAPAPLRPVLKPLSLRRDPELEVGARAHFEDPVYYAHAYRDRRKDVDYYVSLASSVTDVLEQGVGEGRIALPMARRGTRVTGIDHSPEMLAHFRSVLRSEPEEVRERITLRRGDLRTTRLDRRFPLVLCPFNTALHLYTRRDVERWLARVHEHLTPRGELVFDVSMPIPDDLARDPATAYRVPPFRHPSLGHVRYSEHFDYDRVRQILFVAMVFEPVAGAKSKRSARADAGGSTVMTPLAHRQFFPQELEALLHYNGFRVTDVFGDFERGPLRQDSDVMVWHARKANARARSR